MTVNSEVLKTVQRAVIDAIGSLSIVLPIQAIDVEFKRPNDMKYFQLVNIPFDQAEMWGREEILAGQLNSILHWPAVGTGPYGKIQLLEELATVFPKGKRLFSDNFSILISKNPLIGQAMRGNYVDGTGFQVSESGSETLTVLSVSYSTFKL